MKKYFFMIMAAVVCLTASMTVISCGGEDYTEYDDTTVEPFTFYFTATSGELSDEELAEIVKGATGEAPVVTISKTMAAARYTYDQIVEKFGTALKNAVAETKSKKGITDLQLHYFLKDSSGKIIKEHVFE